MNYLGRSNVNSNNSCYLLYEKNKRWAVSDMLKEIGLMLEDEDSILFQAAKNDVPIFCPAITDGAFGFHLFILQQKHKDFVVDVVKDFSNILLSQCQNQPYFYE